MASLQILFIEERPVHERLLREVSAGGSSPYTCRSAARLQDALDVLAEQPFDLVLFDPSLPDSAGLEGVVRLHRTAPGVPIIVLAESDDEQAAARAAASGACDCLVKGRFSAAELHRRIRHAADYHQWMAHQVEQARVTALRELTGRMTHDVNNAISPVAICVESVIESEPQLSDEARESLSTILQAADAVVRTVGREQERYREEERALAPAEWSSIASSSAVPQRILVADDDPLLLKSLTDVLTGDGHAVTGVRGGVAAVEAFRTAAATGSPFGVVITDLAMPDVDGQQVATAVKADSETPVILLTGGGQTGEGGLPPHIDRVLNKPPRLADLRAAVRMLTSGRRP